MKFSLLSLLLILISLLTQAQSLIPHSYRSSRSFGLSNLGFLQTGHYAIFDNIGASAYMENAAASFSMNNNFLMQGFSTLAAGYNQPFKNGNFSAGIFRFGDQIFNQSALSFGYAHGLDKAGLGIKANLIQVSIEEYGTVFRPLFEFGGIAELTEKLFFAGTIYNFTLTSLSEFEDERLPTVMSGGLKYELDDKINLYLGTFKDIEYPASLHAAISYQLLKPLQLNAGFSTLANSLHFGSAINVRQYVFDFSVNHQYDLGYSTAVSVLYNFDKKSE